MGPDDKLSEAIVVKLFDQVKDANNQNTDCIKDLTRVVDDLAKCIEKQPDLNDMAKMCIHRGHDAEEIKKGNAVICKTTKKILGRVSVMIATVCIVFVLMTMSYFFVRNSIEDMIDRRVSEIYQIQNSDDE